MVAMGAAIYIISITGTNALALFLWIAWLKKKDLYAKRKGQPKVALIFTLFGMLSAPLSLLFYASRGMEIVAAGTGGNQVFYFFLVVGVCEEAGKLTVFLLLSRLLKSVKDPMDAVIQGAAVGLGFAVVENFFYGMDYGLTTLVVRSVVCIIAHMTYSALSAFGFASMRFSQRVSAEHFLLPVKGYLLAVFLHGTSNSLLLLDTLVPALLVDAISLYILYAILAKEAATSPYQAFPPRDWMTAVSLISRGIKFDPCNKNLFLRRGFYYLCGDRYPEALEDFKAMARLAEDKRYANACIALAQALLNDTVKARENLASKTSSLSASQRRSLHSSVARALKGTRRQSFMRQLEMEGGRV
jgi:RsiW-degrading membrane proteinase PrsW (M82 family)